MILEWLAVILGNECRVSAWDAKHQEMSCLFLGKGKKKYANQMSVSSPLIPGKML